jgi:hypothetical protein
MPKQLFNYPSTILFALFLFVAASTQAQYHAAVGLRAGKFNSGVTARYFLWPDNATESTFDLAIPKLQKAAGS